MATKQECIEKLTELDVEFDPNLHVSKLNKLLKENQSEVVVKEKIVESIPCNDDYEIQNKDILRIGVTGELEAKVEGILPCGSDRNHPYTRYKVNIDGDRHLMSERLVKKLFIKEGE